jgi:branched-subunit amino acid transport protein
MSTPLSAIELALALLGIALTTLVTRAALLLVGHRLKFSERVQTALQYAPACAFAALIVPTLLFQGGDFAVTLANAKLPGAVAGALAFLATRSIVGCIVIGMAVFTLWRLFVS